MLLFERQRLLLSLLDALAEPVGHMDFQKLLLLYLLENGEHTKYEFVPYKFGGFSFTSYADKRQLIAKGLLEDNDEIWNLTGAGRVAARRQSHASSRAKTFCRRYAGCRGNALLVEAYRRQPYFAIRSEIVDKLQLDCETIATIEAARPKRQAPGLVTIGYERRSLEGFLNELLHGGVTMLCDVRRNPLSRKYGFSKATLRKACEGVGIGYEHLPELGIASEDRQNLRTQADYDLLFAEYERESLPRNTAALEHIRRSVNQGERVALMCFERLPEQCHRHCVAEELARLEGARLRPVHL